MLEGNFVWGTVKLTIWAYKINSLHENNFILVTKIEEL